LRLKRRHVTSLIEEFHYPRLGPGQMWEKLAAISEERGIDVRVNHRVTRVLHDETGVTAIEVHRPDGESEVVAVDGIVSSIALSELVLSLDPLPPDEIVEAARRLRYRDLLVVGLISTDPEPFPDNWIYLHDPGTRAGRVQNFGAWSPGMTRPGFTCLGVEYFCFQGDETWSLPDHALVGLAKRELGKIGLIDPAHVVGGVAIRVPRAYPMYDKGYDDAVALLRDHVSSIGRLQTVGRNGLHRYNNQDHSMWTAVLGTLNLLDGADNDVWAVNADAEYLEETDLQNPIEAAGAALATGF
jgi:protoporphyrinogen oxidase